jgi:hypothetical protein
MPSVIAHPASGRYITKNPRYGIGKTDIGASRAKPRKNQM